MDIALGSEANDNLDSADETSATFLGYAQDGQLPIIMKRVDGG